MCGVGGTGKATCLSALPLSAPCRLASLPRHMWWAVPSNSTEAVGLAECSVQYLSGWPFSGPRWSGAYSELVRGPSPAREEEGVLENTPALITCAWGWAEGS